MYGADAGGVVNVLTRAGEGRVNGRVGLERGTFETEKLDASIAGGGEVGDYYLSVTDLTIAGFNSQTADAVLEDDDGAENTTLHAKLGWAAADNLRLQLVARDIDATTQYDSCFSPDTFETTHDCVGTTEQTTYKVSAAHDAGRLRNVLGLSGIDIVRDNFADGASSFATEGRLVRFEYTGSFVPTDRTTVVYGLDLQDEEVVSGDVLERDQEGYYFEYQGELGDSFFVSAGARYDDNEDFGAHTSARLSTAYVQLLGRERSLKYRASLGTGFRAPSLYETAYNRGPFSFPPASGTMLGEESSRGYDLGIEYHADEGLHFELTYFDQSIEDEIFFDLTGFSGYLQSPGTGDSKGIEIAARIPVGARWSLQGNWTNNDTRDTTNEQRLRRPENLGNIGASYRSPDGRLRFVANYRMSMDAIDIAGVVLQDYEVLDLALAYSFAERLDIFGRIENATNESYQEIVNFNAAGRGAYAGVRLRF
jgi:vitamin B12 transporter